MLNLNEGEPLTYAFIKSMIAEINSLEKRVNDINQEAQFIEIKGTTGEKSADFKNKSILVYCGSVAYDRKETKATFNKSVTFTDASFTQAPIVVATVRNETTAGAENAVITVSKVTTTGFDIFVNILGGGLKTDNKIIKVNYIAIGPSGRNTTKSNQ